MDDKESKYKLIESIAFLLASGKISPEEALPALQKINEKDFKLSDIQTVLESQASNEFQTIIASLQKSRIGDAIKFYKQNKAGRLDSEYFSKNLDTYPQALNCDWHPNEKISILKEFCELVQDYHFINKQSERLPVISRRVELRFESFSRDHLKEVYLWAGVDPEKLIKLLWDQVDDESRKDLRAFKLELKDLLETQNEKALIEVQSLPKEPHVEDHNSYIYALGAYKPDSEEAFVRFCDLIFLWPARDIVPVFKSLWQVESYRERLSVLLHMRFGDLKDLRISSWEDFFEKESKVHEQKCESLKSLSAQFSAALIYLWSLRYPGVSQETASIFEKIACEKA